MQSKRDNLCVGTAGLGIGGTPSQVAIGFDFPYQIAGRTFRKAATASVPLVPRAGTAPLSVPANSTQVLFFHVDPAGNVTYSQARQVVVSVGIMAGLQPSLSAPGYTPGAIEWPQEDAGFAVIGAVKIATNATGAFVPGTTAFNAANQVATFYNVSQDLGVPIPT